MDVEQHSLNTQKWWGSFRSIPQDLRLVSEESVDAEPHWSRGAHWAACGCYLVEIMEMGQFPSNYMKEGQMQMEDNLSSHPLGTAQCRRALTHTLKSLEGSQKP